MIILPPLDDSEMSLVDNALNNWLGDCKRLAKEHRERAPGLHQPHRIAENRLADEFDRTAEQIQKLLDYFESDARDV